MSDQILGRILVVDDEEDLRNVLVSTLNRQGYEAVGFAAGQDALTLLETGTYDILLSDLMMPGMDGLTLLHKSLELDPNLIVLIMTGQGTVQTATEAMKSGAFDYLLKPFKVQTLLPSLTRALEVRRLRLDNLQLREAVTIYQLSQAIALTLDPQTIVEKTAEASLQLWDADEVSVLLLLVTPQGDELQVATVRGENRAKLLDQRLPLDRGIAGWVARHHEPVILADAAHDPRFESLHPRPDLQASVSMPMLAGNKLVGVLNVNALRRPRPFTPGQVKALSVLANTAASAIANAQLNAQLREDEERFRALIENSSDAIALLDTEGRVVYDSPAAPGLLGYDSPELIGRTVFDQVHPDDQAEVQALFGQLLQTENARLTTNLRFRHKTGTWLWLEVVASNLLTKPGVRAVVLNYRDITERKQAEAALAVSEEKYRTLVEAADDVILLTDLQGRHLFRNKAFYLSLGYEVGDEGSLDEYSHVHSDDLPVLESKIGQLLTNGMVTHEYRVRHKNGDWIYRSAKTTVINDEHQQPKAFLSIIRDITERKQAEWQIRTQVDRLTALRTIDAAITGSLDLRLTLNVVLDQVITQLGVDAASVLLLNSHSKMLQYSAGRGFRNKAFERTQLRLGEGYAGRAALERHSVHISKLADQHDNPRLAKHLTDEGFVTYFGVPLIGKGQVKGVLEIFQRAPLDPSPDWLNFLETLSRQAAIAIDNAQLFDNLQRSNSDLILAYDATIEGWSRALDLRDKETEGHTQRVTELTMQLAEALGFKDEDLLHIRRGALLHDIGKMGVPDHILLKPGPLTDEEWVVMRKHPGYAFEMLSPIAYLHPALDIPYCHHEKWDGTGYPRGLKGEEIRLPARLFAVVDVWDALRSDRPYRLGWPDEKVRQHLRQEAGTHFDPQVVEVFLKMIQLGGLSTRENAAT